MRAGVRAVRWLAAVLLIAYSLVIARLTLAPASSETGIFDRLNSFMINLSDGRLQWSQTEVLANVALFVPAGFLLAIAAGRAWLAIITCVLASAAIELAQQHYFPSRVPSLADVEHNGLGAVIGAVIAIPLLYLLRRAAHRPDWGGPEWPGGGARSSQA